MCLPQSLTHSPVQQLLAERQIDMIWISQEYRQNHGTAQRPLTGEEIEMLWAQSRQLWQRLIRSTRLLNE
jgi:hypothetical protein